MAQAFPASRFTGYDFSEQAIATARAEAVELGVPNANFEARDLASLDTSEAFDAIVVFDAIHDQVHPDKVLANIRRALRTGGDLLMVDIKASSELAKNREIPWASWLYTVSTMHCMTVSLSAGGAGLGKRGVRNWPPRCWPMPASPMCTSPKSTPIHSTTTTSPTGKALTASIDLRDLS